VIVHLDGFEYVYEVRSVRRVMPGDLSVLGHSDTPVLTLITCQGYDPYGNAYRYRVAVRAVLVAIH
jgi:sortase (surface protein transpeptidase)